MSPPTNVSIQVTKNGPYQVTCGLAIRNSEGESLESGERYRLCRCGQSSNKPFCDGTHNRIDFDGTETADHGSIDDRQLDYPGHNITIHDDRTVCAHAGFCSDNLRAVFRLGEEPWIDATGADTEAIITQVKECPSGALRFSLGGVEDEDTLAQEIIPSPDGPLWLRGGVKVVSSDGEPYEPRNRQTLCRCGGSSNKPFCDGTHWHIGFTAP